jgi:hypothetical protein
VKKIAVLAFDGPWSHVRWSGQCFGLFIDLIQRRIVDFELVLTRKCGGDFDGAGQALEGESFRRMAARWRATGKDLRGLVHDRDAKVTKIIDEMQWDVVEFFD